jgi:hypothetical protein
MVAHGASREINARDPSPGRGERFTVVGFRPCRGLAKNPANPRLTPWATFFRCSAAKTMIQETRHNTNLGARIKLKIMIESGRRMGLSVTPVESRRS